MYSTEQGGVSQIIDNITLAQAAAHFSEKSGEKGMAYNHTGLVWSNV